MKNYILTLITGLIAWFAAPAVVGQITDPWPDTFPPPSATAATFKKTHPGWDLDTIHPADFSPLVSGMDFLPDGRMVLLTYKPPEVFILDGVLGTNRAAVKATKIADGFSNPLGLKVVDGEIYVLDFKQISHLKLKPGAMADKEAIGPVYNLNAAGHPTVFGLAYKDGAFYHNFGMWDGPAGQLGHTVKTTLAGQREVLGSGLRTPDGLAFGPNGDLFSVDLQGDWLPCNKFIHMVKGRWYGHDKSKVAGDVFSPPAVYLPHGEVAMSPSQPLFVPSGLYKDQFLLGDVRFPEITRIFLEKVQGEYQGAAFRFSGSDELEAGVHRMVWGPDSNIYLGEIGGADFGHWTWSWGTRTSGLGRLKPNGKDAFEMLSAKARVGGIELEFTEAVGASAGNISSYVAQMWHYVPTLNYGGPKTDTATLKVAAVQIHPDKKHVFLSLPGMKAGFLVYLKLNSFQSASARPLWTQETWYTLNKLSDTQPFADVVVNVRAHEGTPQALGSWSLRNTGTGLGISVSHGGQYRVRLMDIQGKVAADVRGAGSNEQLIQPSHVGQGLYQVEVTTEAGRSFRTAILN